MGEQCSLNEKKKIRERKNPLIKKSLCKHKEINISVSEGLPHAAVRHRM